MPPGYLLVRSSRSQKLDYLIFTSLLKRVYVRAQADVREVGADVARKELDVRIEEDVPRDRYPQAHGLEDRELVVVRVPRTPQLLPLIPQDRPEVELVVDDVLRDGVDLKVIGTEALVGLVEEVARVLQRPPEGEARLPDIFHDGGRPVKAPRVTLVPLLRVRDERGGKLSHDLEAPEVGEIGVDEVGVVDGELLPRPVKPLLESGVIGLDGGLKRGRHEGAGGEGDTIEGREAVPETHVQGHVLKGEVIGPRGDVGSLRGQGPIQRAGVVIESEVAAPLGERARGGTQTPVGDHLVSFIDLRRSFEGLGRFGLLTLGHVTTGVIVTLRDGRDGENQHDAKK